MELRDFLQETAIECIEECSEFSVQEWSQIFRECDNDFVNFPKIKEPDADTDWVDEMDNDIGYNPEESYEDLDFENFELLGIDFDNNSFLFCAGGDWQDPLEVTVTYDGKFYFEITGKGFTEGMSDEHFLVKVFGEDWQEILKEEGYTDIL
jgi:hypothetical protein